MQSGATSVKIRQFAQWTMVVAVIVVVFMAAFNSFGAGIPDGVMNAVVGFAIFCLLLLAIGTLYINRRFRTINSRLGNAKR
jgi:amino acid transporter